MQKKDLDSTTIVRSSRFIDENTFKHAVIYEKANIERNDSSEANSPLKKEKERFIDN